MHYLAIDLASKFHRIRITDEKGATISNTFSIDNNQNGFNELISRLDKLSIRLPIFSQDLKPPTTSGKISTNS